MSTIIIIAVCAFIIGFVIGQAMALERTKNRLNQFFEEKEIPYRAEMGQWGLNVNITESERNK